MRTVILALAAVSVIAATAPGMARPQPARQAAAVPAQEADFFLFGRPADSSRLLRQSGPVCDHLGCPGFILFGV